MTTQRSRWGSLARWTGCLLFGGLAGAALGAVVGARIGDSLGPPEGEGFVGFILGLRFGALLGLAVGGALAWRWGRGATLPGSIPPNSPRTRDGRR